MAKLQTTLALGLNELMSVRMATEVSAWTVSLCLSNCQVYNSAVLYSIQCILLLYISCLACQALAMHWFIITISCLGYA